MEYFCDKCNTTFDSKQKLYFDFLEHIKFYKCEVCEENEKVEQFKNRSDYIVHMKTEHKVQGNGLPFLSLYNVDYIHVL